SRELARGYRIVRGIALGRARRQRRAAGRAPGAGLLTCRAASPNTTARLVEFRLDIAPPPGQSERSPPRRTKTRSRLAVDESAQCGDAGAEVRFHVWPGAHNPMTDQRKAVRRVQARTMVLQRSRQLRVRAEGTIEQSRQLVARARGIAASTQQLVARHGLGQ